VRSSSPTKFQLARHVVASLLLAGLLPACDLNDAELAKLVPDPSVNTELLLADGTIDVLTYNVAGLPELIPGTGGTYTHPLISPRLNLPYELVLVQEDFCYHDLLRDEVELLYESVPAFDQASACIDPDSIGDGLNTFSDIPFAGFERVPWTFCSGELDCKSDCLTPKGFTYARHHLMGLGNLDAVIDVYNIHTDSGSCRTDFEARGRQIEQLIDAIKARSAGKAVIVAGDTNLRDTRFGDPQILDVLLETAALRDACREMNCGDERLDRILVRSAPNLILEVVDWDVPDDDFQDNDGEDLSDHKPVSAAIAWELIVP